MSFTYMRLVLAAAWAAHFYRQIDCHLFNIPKAKLNYPKEVLGKQHLHLSTLRDDHTTLEMSDFWLYRTLCCIYRKFGI